MVSAADALVADLFRKKGFSVLTSGWPDLLVYDDKRGAVMAVELKRGNDRLRPEQQEMARVFTDYLRVPFFVARDNDVATVLRKRGRILMPGVEKANLEARIAVLEDQLAMVTKWAADLVREFEATTAVWDPGPDFRAHFDPAESLPVEAAS